MKVYHADWYWYRISSYHICYHASFLGLKSSGTHWNVQVWFCIWGPLRNGSEKILNCWRRAGSCWFSCPRWTWSKPSSWMCPLIASDMEPRIAWSSESVNPWTKNLQKSTSVLLVVTPVFMIQPPKWSASENSGEIQWFIISFPEKELPLLEYPPLPVDSSGRS